MNSVFLRIWHTISHQKDFPHVYVYNLYSTVMKTSHHMSSLPHIVMNLTQKLRRICRGIRTNHCKIAHTLKYENVLTMKYDSPFPKVNLSFVWSCTRQNNFVW